MEMQIPVELQPVLVKMAEHLGTSPNLVLESLLVDGLVRRWGSPSPLEMLDAIESRYQIINDPRGIPVTMADVLFKRALEFNENQPFKVNELVQPSEEDLYNDKALLIGSLFALKVKKSNGAIKAHFGQKVKRYVRPPKGPMVVTGRKRTVMHM